MIGDPKRHFRSRADLDAVRRRSPDVFELADRLGDLPHVTVHPDGTGKCVYKAYLNGALLKPRDRDHSFLWIYEPIDESYVSWAQQHGFIEVCRECFGHLIEDRSRKNSSGAYLKRGTTLKQVTVATKAYLECLWRL